MHQHPQRIPLPEESESLSVPSLMFLLGHHHMDRACNLKAQFAFDLIATAGFDGLFLNDFLLGNVDGMLGFPARRKSPCW